MALVKFIYGTQEQIANTSLSEGTIYFATDCGAIAYDLKGSRHWSSLIKHGTTAYWSQQTSYIPSFGEIIVYDDYKVLTNRETTENVPGIKVGNGNGVVVDLPFITDYLSVELSNHINDTVVHITATEREKWNNKVRCFIDTNIEENLIFTTD